MNTPPPHPKQEPIPIPNSVDSDFSFEPPAIPLDPEELIQIRTNEALQRRAEKLHLMNLQQWNQF